jgi:hypothetical protein
MPVYLCLFGCLCDSRFDCGSGRKSHVTRYKLKLNGNDKKIYFLFANNINKNKIRTHKTSNTSTAQFLDKTSVMIS